MTSDYLQKLARLRTDANRSRWTEATSFRAPNKSLFLSYFWQPTSDIRHLIFAFVSKMTQDHRPIFKPSDERHIPDQECLGWHRREVFRT